MSRELREEFLRLLDEDREFRYAVAGYLGLGEILKKLEAHDRKFNEIVERLDRHEKILEEHTKILNEHTKILNEHTLELRGLRREVTEIRRYIERTSITLEEEAKEVLEYRLMKKGIPVELKRLMLPEIEVNIYGVYGDMCMVGEVSTRLGAKLIDELGEKLETLKSKHPSLLKPKIIKVLYTMVATDEALEKAKKEGIWVLKATADLTPPPI